MHRYVLYNREIRDSKELLLSPGQVGFLNGWGVFSTLRVSEGILFAFERHYDRMQRDAELLHVPFTLPPAFLKDALLSLVAANHAWNATLRVAVVRNKGGLFEAPGVSRDAELIAFTADLTEWGRGVNLTYLPNGRFGASRFSSAKITSWAHNLVCNEEAHRHGFDEVILLNEHGNVSECTSANIFAIEDNSVWTPPLSTSGCLPGVTRALLLEEIQVPGLTIRERELTPSQLEASDQVFITSTTRNLLPVLTIDHLVLSQRPEMLHALQLAFTQLQAHYFSAQRGELAVQ